MNVAILSKFPPQRPGVMAYAKYIITPPLTASAVMVIESIMCFSLSVTTPINQSWSIDFNSVVSEDGDGKTVNMKGTWKGGFGKYVSTREFSLF